MQVDEKPPPLPTPLRPTNFSRPAAETEPQQQAASRLPDDMETDDAEPETSAASRLGNAEDMDISDKPALMPPDEDRDIPDWGSEKPNEEDPDSDAEAVDHVSPLAFDAPPLPVPCLAVLTAKEKEAVGAMMAYSDALGDDPRIEPPLPAASPTAEVSTPLASSAAQEIVKAVSQAKAAAQEMKATRGPLPQVPAGTFSKSKGTLSATPTPLQESKEASPQAGVEAPAVPPPQPSQPPAAPPSATPLVTPLQSSPLATRPSAPAAPPAPEPHALHHLAPTPQHLSWLTLV